jgi:2',3'-cyclic-nucleotide 2'-phosphodiesterase (5'-nucleotidase family)
LLGLLASAPAAANGKSDVVEIQIIDISDWHAQLDPLFVFGVGSFGGAAELSTYWQMDRQANPNTLTLTAGDAYGASPPLSNFFDEIPAVQSMNLMGFDVDTFGNHNFDRGVDHLQQMVDLAKFRYVSANLQNMKDGKPAPLALALRQVKPFRFFNFSGVKVAVIGITNPEAPTLVFPGSFGTIEVTDPVAAAMEAREQAERQGADVFVAITHLGVTGFDGGGAVGPLIDFANSVSGFDVIFGDHTDVQFEGVINGALVVENRSKGRTYSRTHVTYSKRDGGVTGIANEFVLPFSDAVDPDPVIVDFLQPFRDELDALLGVVIGESTVFIPRADSCGVGNGRTCESLVGDVTTDAMRMRYGVDFAITNSGGLRANLTCPMVDDPNDFCPPFTGPNFDITSGQVLTVLPFGNVVVTLDLNGAELKTMLENGVSAMPGIDGRFAQVSGLCFTYDIDAAPGSRVMSAVRQLEDGSCGGVAVDLTAGTTYTLAENDFMANGGDGYPDFSSRAVSREFMDQVVSDYIAANSPIAPTIEGRINWIGATCPLPVP